MNNPSQTLTEIIRSRRSIFPKNFSDKKVPKEVIRAILENANFAPTHKLTQPWRFTVFYGEGLKKLATFVGEHYKSTTPPEKFLQKKYEEMQEKILKSAAVITINISLHPDKLPEWEETASVACAVQNMWLTATSLHVGTYWSTPGVIHSMHDFLGLGEDEKCIGFFYMGYHDEPAREADRTPMDSKVKWVEN